MRLSSYEFLKCVVGDRRWGSAPYLALARSITLYETRAGVRSPFDDGEFAAWFLMAVEPHVQQRFRDARVECSPIKRHYARLRETKS